MFKDCKSNKTCVYCGEFNVYHRSLCPKRFPLSTSMASVVHKIEPKNKVSEENGLHVIKMSMNEMVMMQTALTDVINTETNESHQVRLLMDSGSHSAQLCVRSSSHKHFCFSRMSK